MSKGCLYLIPTPLNPEDQLDPKTLELLQKTWSSSLVLVEDHKIGRRKWLYWGLEREAIENFQVYNDHNQKDVDAIVAQMRQGKNVLLFCDEGLPAFCDPGKPLVRRCQEEGLKVTCPSFAQSTTLAIALSGFSHWPIYFAGFPPREADDRQKFWQDIWSRKEVVVIMDTPYRLKKIGSELKSLAKQRNRMVYIGMNLTLENEMSYWGPAAKVPDYSSKEEFILVIE